MKSIYWLCIQICLFFQQVYLVNCSDENGKLNLTPRIVGGRRAHEGEFLGIVSIQTWKNEHFCGGTWFEFENRTQILTAAHCVVDKKKKLLDKSLLQVMGNDLSILPFGSSKRQVRKIAKIVAHPYYNPAKLTNDIAIMFLTSPFEQTKEFAPIQLTNEAIFDNQHCNVAGWGHLEEGGTRSNYLRATNVSVVMRDECNVAMRGQVGKHSFCAGARAGGRDTCQGDSGGGLLSKNILIGIVSSGIGCGQKGYPGIYTNVHHYNHWIRQVVNTSSYSILSPLLVLIEIAVIVSY